MALDVKHKYPTLVSLIQHSETVRWTRLNNFLLLESVLAAAWGAVATSDVLKGSSLFLTILCGLGCLFAVLWVGLAVRSSEFLRLYQELGRKAEPGAGWPFTDDEKIRNEGSDFFKSQFITVAVPVAFLALFAFLAWKSWNLGTAGGNMNFSLEWVQIILTAIATGALVWTLIYVAQYTKATKGMADAAQASTEAALKAEEIRRQPVVQISVDPERQKEFYFRTVIANNGIAHAKLRILATIKVNAVNLVLTKDHLYNGERIWNLHAGHGIRGHLDFEGVFEHNKLHESLGERDNVIVTLTLWVINYNDSVESLYSGKVRMPVLSYEWSGSSAKDAQGQWVPDPAAELFDDELQADQK